MTINERLNELGISLAETPKPLGSYLPYVRSGNLIFMSGVLPLRNGKLVRTGRVGEAVSLDEAREDARQVVVNALSVLNVAAGDLGKISKCVKLNGYVASAADFTDQPKVLNGASDLLVDLYGDRGRHTRLALGIYEIANNVPIETQLVVSFKS